MKTSRPKSYQNVGGSKVPPAIPTKSLSASIEMRHETVVPQFAHLESVAVFPLSVSYENASQTPSLEA